MPVINNDLSPKRLWPPWPSCPRIRVLPARSCKLRARRRPRSQIVDRERHRRAAPAARELLLHELRLAGPPFREQRLPQAVEQAAIARVRREGLAEYGFGLGVVARTQQRGAQALAH